MHARLTFNSGIGFQAVNRRKMNTENVRQTLRTAHQIRLPFDDYIKAKFHYAILLANQLASWFASWSAT